MKKFTVVFFMIIILLVTGCCKESKDALKFKKEYESINGKDTGYGKKHRILNINKNNPFVYISTKDLIKKIDNKDTFYVYFGSPKCPWCRSALEKAIEVANKNNIDKIYYVDIWDKDGNEILRDRYIVEDGKLQEKIKGTDDYYILLDKLKNVLSDYSVTDESGKEYDVNEKRIYAPNYIYIKNGKAKSLIEGTSNNQKDPFEKLTDKLLKDEEKMFNNFFKNK